MAERMAKVVSKLPGYRGLRLTKTLSRQNANYRRVTVKH